MAGKFLSPVSIRTSPDHLQANINDALMKRLLASILALSTFILAGCGDEKKDTKKDDQSDPKPKSIPGEIPEPKPAPAPEPAATVTAADRDAFLGTWQGKYSGIDDEMVIEAGQNDDEVVITIHASFENPDKVKGKLVAADKIDVPKQPMGGSPGTAEITLVDGKLHYKQSGLGITVEGVDYEKQ